MIQGTTPTIRLRFPFDARMLYSIDVSFLSGHPDEAKVILTKTIGYGDITGTDAVLELTQEETRLMDGLTVAEVRARTKTGKVLGFRHAPLWMRRTVGEAVL